MIKFSSDLVVPGTKTKTGDRAFWVAGPRTRSSLCANRAIRETKSFHA